MISLQRSLQKVGSLFFLFFFFWGGGGDNTLRSYRVLLDKFNGST